MYTYGLTETEVTLRKVPDKGTPELAMSHPKAELEARLSGEDNEYFFNGSVDGSFSEICCFLRDLQASLRNQGISCSFEIYNENYDCIGEIDG